MQNFALIPNMMFISFETEVLITKISEYELIFMMFWHYMTKKSFFFNNEIIFSKTHAYFFWHIYKDYNYDKRINKTCIYGKLMPLEGTPSEGHIPIYRLSPDSASCSKIILLISVKSSFLHRALSHTLIKILGEHKIKIKCTKNINILSYFTDNVWI
jgi:hypothetical protein